jgi:hypothetical protein
MKENLSNKNMLEAFKITRWRKGLDLAKNPIYVLPGDRLVLSHKDEKGVTRELVNEEIGRRMKIVEAVTFDAKYKDSESGEEQDAIGGAFLTEKRKPV